MRGLHNNRLPRCTPPRRASSHTRVSLSSLWLVETRSLFREHTHESRQPMRAAVIIESGLSALYPMAGLSNLGMDLDGRRQPTGLEIS